MATELEQTNQVEEEMELFDDYDGLEDTNEEPSFTDNSEAQGDVENGAGEQTNDPEPTQDEEKHEVTYNGQKFSLTLDELKTNAQKGMNYDHVNSQLQSLKNSPALAVIKSYADRSGMTVDQYAEYVQSLENQQKINGLVDEGVPEATARRLIELEKKEDARLAQEKEENNKQKEQQQFSDFIKNYPDVAAADIPTEVWERHRNGMDLTYAYAMHENQRLKTEIAQMKQNNINKEKSIGSASGESSGADTDLFLEGLFG